VNDSLCVTLFHCDDFTTDCINYIYIKFCVHLQTSFNFGTFSFLEQTVVIQNNGMSLYCLSSERLVRCRTGSALREEVHSLQGVTAINQKASLAILSSAHVY